MSDWMAEACAEAVRGMEAGEGGPFGAVVVRDGVLVARAHNRVLATHDPTAHAEVLAIRRAAAALGRPDLSDCILYASCEPCPMCLGAVFWARLPRVFFAATAADAARGGFDDRRFHERMAGGDRDAVLQQLDAEAGRAVFDRWLARDDRQLY